MTNDGHDQRIVVNLAVPGNNTFGSAGLPPMSPNKSKVSKGSPLIKVENQSPDLSINK